MFRFSVLRAVHKTLDKHGKVLNDVRQTPALFHTTSILLRTEIEDVQAVRSIEENLFENSERRSSFVSTKHLLQNLNRERNRSHRKKPAKNESNAKTKHKENDEATTFTPFAPKKIVKKPSVPAEPIVDEEIGFRYTKLQRNDQTLQQLMLMVKSKKHRNIKHQLLLEGRRLIIDALKCGLPLKYLIFSDIEQLKLVAKLPEVPKDVTCYKVPQGDLSLWSTLTTCPGLMAIVEKPVDMTPIWKQKDPLPIIVICDQVREPNNVGSIIRACASLPVEKVILTKGCADHWDTKALRGGAGAQFLVPSMGPMAWDSIYSILPYNYSVLVAENNSENVEKNLGATQLHRFVAYSDLEPTESCVVVIGGETEGVSAEAYELLKMNSNGCCVHIPLANGIDSLNTSTALAVLLFEIRKKMTEQLARTKTNDASTEANDSLPRSN